MDIQQATDQELNRIHRSRNRIGYFPPLLVFVISSYFQRETLPFETPWLIAVSLIVIGTLLRVLIGEVFFQQWEKKALWARFVNLLSYFLVGAGWGMHFSDICFHFGPESKNVFYAMLLISAFIIGASTSLVAHKLSYIVFVSTFSIGVFLTYFTSADFSDSYILLNIVIFLGFSVTSFKLGHQQLCDLIASQLKAQAESDRLKHIINAVPGYVGLIDKEGTCYMANQATLNLYPDIVGRKIGSIDSQNDWEKYILGFLHSDKKNEVVSQHSVFEGKDAYFLVNSHKMDDGGMISISADMTELVEAQNTIREQEGKAQYSARLASIGQMAAGIAHEVNNPLTIILGAANIIKKLVSSEPMDVENIKLLSEKVVETSDRISKTVRSLKTLSRNGEMDPMEKVSIRRIIEICLDISQQRFKQHHIELKLVKEIPDIEVLGREVQLSQVIINLLANAIDATKNMDNPWVEIQVQETQDWIEILVIDSGPGIPKEIRKKIMEPFFTTKDVNEGTGLGLSISKNIMKEHEGELSLVDNVPHTTFRVRLPKTDQKKVP